MNFEPLESRRLMSVLLVSGTLTVENWQTTNNLSVSQSGSTLTVNDNGAVSSYSTSGVSQIWLKGWYGNDQLSADGVTINTRIDGSYGNDQITGGQGNDTIYGGPGNDVIRAGPLSPPVTLLPGPRAIRTFDGSIVYTPVRTLVPVYLDDDFISGEAGNDIIVGGIGADDITGGSGTDLVSYSDRTAAVSVSLDDVANDGAFNTSTWQSTEFDNVRSDVENLQGGSGNDLIFGSAVANTLFGEGGNDSLYGFGGSDILEGSIGNDYLVSGDGNDAARGGDGDDTIYAGTGDDLLDGMAGNDYLDAGDGTDVVVGGVGNDTTYGGAGDDQIDMMAGADWVYAGDGNDTVRGGDDNDNLFGNNGIDVIYSGAGNDGLYGGEGNDTLVSIGGGQSDYNLGEGGSDSFWVDAESTEIVADLSPAEAAAGHLHRVAGFMATTVFNNGVPSFEAVSRELNGQALQDPAVFSDQIQNGNGTTSTVTPTYMSFGGRALFSSAGPQMTDVRQGRVGDCYFLAGLSATAKANPDRIRQGIVDLGDGTYGVQFFRNGVVSFVRVDADLPTVNGAAWYARPTNGSLWAPLMEKAYAMFRRTDGQYASIAGGTAGETFSSLGVASGWGWRSPFQSGSDFLRGLQDEINLGKAVTLSTPPAVIGSQLVSLHVYVVDRVVFDSNGVATDVVLRNPWGTDRNGPSTDGADDGFVTVSAGDIYWTWVQMDSATV